MNDYIIAVDRDGQPYIAHAWGRGTNGQHKYIAKIGEGAKARYFYTQEQLRAFQQGARQGAQNAGVQAKQRATNVANQVKNTAQSKLEKAVQVKNNVSNEFKKSAEANRGKKPTATITNTRIDKNGNKIVTTGKEARKEITDQAKKQLKLYSGTAKYNAQANIADLKNKIRNTAEDAAVYNKASRALGISDLHDAKYYEKAAEVAKKSGDEKHAKEYEKIAKNMRESYDEKLLGKAEKAIDNKKSENKVVSSKSKFSEYTKGDKDFDDKNFAEKNRVGDSDFFMAKRPDGSTVILEEDMKWVLPMGVNPNDPAIKRAITIEYKAGSNEEWVKQVTEAIDDAVEEANKKK